mgnify:FL=1
MAVPDNIVKSLPIHKRMWIPLLNLVGKKCEFRIIVTSPNYVNFRVLWGAISYETGEKREFVVRGTEKYVNSIISSMEMREVNARSIMLK